MNERCSTQGPAGRVCRIGKPGGLRPSGPDRVSENDKVGQQPDTLRHARSRKRICPGYWLAQSDPDSRQALVYYLFKTALGADLPGAVIPPVALIDDAIRADRVTNLGPPLCGQSTLGGSRSLQRT